MNMRLLLTDEEGGVELDVACPDALSINLAPDGIFANYESGSDRLVEFDGLSWFDASGNTVEFKIMTVQSPGESPHTSESPHQTQVWTVTLPDDSAVDVTIANLYDDEMRLTRILELAGLDAYCTYR